MHSATSSKGPRLVRIAVLCAQTRVAIEMSRDDCSLQVGERRGKRRKREGGGEKGGEGKGRGRREKEGI